MSPKVLLRYEEVSADLTDIEGYLSEGGYAATRKAVTEMTPDEITTAVKDSGLRGRGGAGFPTGLKWGFVPADTDKPVYLLCNADESEPGTFKDRVIIERDPHQILEGMIIACRAIGC